MNRTIYRMAGLLVALAMTLGNFSHTQAAGDVYYVSPAGNDANPGTSSAPFKTFAKANSLLTAGSTLNLYAGTYTEQLRITQSGTSEGWITVQPIGGSVVIDMNNAALPGISVNASYVTMSGLEVRNSGDICVNLVGSHLSVEDLTVHECYSHGIQANNSSQVKILNSRVYRAALSNANRLISSGWPSGIKVRLSEDVLIQGNTVYHNYGEGMGTRGMNVTIRANTVYDNFSINIYTNSENALIDGNFVYCTPNSGYERDGLPATGIAMAEEYFDGWGARLKNARVINNIVAFCKHGIRYNGAEVGVVGGGLKDATIAYNTLYGSLNSALSIVYESAQTGSLIANNIIWQADNKLAYIDNIAGLTFQNNLWKVLPTSTIRSAGDKIGDPSFAGTPDYTPESYRPLDSSLAAEAAADINITNDFFARQRGPGFDIGAIQFTSGPLVIPTDTSPAVAFTSTPTQTSTPTSIPATVTAPPSTGGNLVLNSSFDIAGSSAGDAANWTEGTNHGRFSDKFHTGGWSLRSTFRGAGTDTRTAAAIAVSPNATYTYSGWIWRANASGAACMDMADIAGERQLCTRVTGVWQLLSGSWNSGSNTSVTLRLITDGSPTGDIWFDDISLVRTEPIMSPTVTNTPFTLTNTPTSTATATRSPTPTMTNTPSIGGNLMLNPGFEEQGSDAADAAHWTEGASHARAADKFHTGGWSLHSTFRGGGTDTRTTVPIAVRPNTDYTYSGYIWRANSTGAACLDMADISGERQLCTAVSGSWQFLSGSWNSGSNTNVTLRLITDGSPTGDIWFDDISLVGPAQRPSIHRLFSIWIKTEHYKCSVCYLVNHPDVPRAGQSPS